MITALSIPASSRSLSMVSGGSIQPRDVASSAWVWESMINAEPPLAAHIVRSSCWAALLIEALTHSAARTRTRSGAGRHSGRYTATLGGRRCPLGRADHDPAEDDGGQAAVAPHGRAGGHL